MRRQRSPVPSLIKENNNNTSTLVLDESSSTTSNTSISSSLEERRRRFLQRLQQQGCCSQLYHHAANRNTTNNSNCGGVSVSPDAASSSSSSSSVVSTKPVTRRNSGNTNNHNDNNNSVNQQLAFSSPFLKMSRTSSSFESMMLLQDQEQQEQKQNEENSKDKTPKSLHPIPQLTETFSEPRFLAEGGYGRVVSAIDLTSNQQQRQQVAIKIMNFECSRDDSQRLKHLANFGDLCRLLPGQDYIPSHIAAELRAHDALREVKGTMPLIRVETWCDESTATLKKHLVYGYEEEVLECFVMLVLPLLTPLSRKFFFSNSSSSSSSTTTMASSIKSLARALRDMHAQGWLHRDLSVTNIFVPSSSSNLIIGDFGLAVCTRNGRSSAINQRFAPSTNACTTIWYRSPEILINPEVPYTTCHDSWALGTVVSELLLGYPLFPGMTREEQLEELEFSLGAKGEKCQKFWNDIFDSLRRRGVSSCENSAVIVEEKIRILQAVSNHLMNFDSSKRSVQKFLETLER